MNQGSEKKVPTTITLAELDLLLDQHLLALAQRYGEPCIEDGEKKAMIGRIDDHTLLLIMLSRIAGALEEQVVHAEGCENLMQRIVENMNALKRIVMEQKK